MAKKTRTLVLTCVVLGVVIASLLLVFLQKAPNEKRAKAVFENTVLFELVLRESDDYTILVEFPPDAAPRWTKDKSVDALLPGTDYNLLRVRGGKIGVECASCPQNLCVRMGMTDLRAFPITCLPHRLVLVVEDAS